MAEIVAKETRQGNERIFTWANVTSADTCESINAQNFIENTVQVYGTLGGGSVPIQGSNDNSNFATLLDLTGVSLTFNSVGIKQILETPEWIKPAPTGVTSITIVLKARRVTN